MKIDTTARLVSVEGDQEEFADMIGTTGRLYLNTGNNWYGPKGSASPLNLARRRVIRKGDKIRVHTKFGNIFTFRLVSESKPVTSSITNEGDTKMQTVEVNGRPIRHGETVVVDHKVQSFVVVVRSMGGVGPDTIKDLIERRHEVVKIERVDEQFFVRAGRPDFPGD